MRIEFTCLAIHGNTSAERRAAGIFRKEIIRRGVSVREQAPGALRVIFQEDAAIRDRDRFRVALDGRTVTVTAFGIRDRAVSAENRLYRRKSDPALRYYRRLRAGQAHPRPPDRLPPPDQHLRRVDAGAVRPVLPRSDVLRRQHGGTHSRRMGRDEA